MMTSPIKKRINTELLNYGSNPLNSGWPGQECDKGGQPMELVVPRIEYNPMLKVPKDARMRSQAATCFKISYTEM